jgi:putative ABC transport system permease protein
MTAIAEGSYDVSGTGEPLEVRGEQVSANFFSVLGVGASLGRTFRPEEDAPEGAGVVVLSNRLWQQRYGRDPTIVGREITINRTHLTVIGVMPAGFYFRPWSESAALWIAGLDLRNPGRTWHNYMCIARLRPQVTMAQARAEMSTLAHRLESQYPEQKGWGVEVVNLHEQVVGDTRPALLVLLAAVGMVLLIACANLANLQLGRVAAREREMAVRTALGAGRRRVVRQLLTENVLLAIAGGGLGLLLASLGVKLLVAFGPQDTPGLASAALNLSVLAFTLVLSIATGMTFGLLPALGASKVDLNVRLKEGSRGSTQGTRGQRFRGALVSLEFALALVLLVGAGLLLRSFVELTRVDLGFDPHGVLTMEIALLGPGYQNDRRQVEFFRELLQRVKSLPGVHSAAALDGTGLPPDGGAGMDFLIEGRPAPPPNERPDASYRVISAEYFRTLRIPLLKGRYLSEGDNEDAPRVAVINERLARDYWPGGDPLGQRIEFPGLGGDQPSWFSIVGVVKSTKNLGLEVEPREEIYVPYDQYPSYFTPRALLVRTSLEPTLLVSSIRRQVELLDRDQPVSEIRTMDQVVGQAMAGRRFPMVLLGLFATLALVLAGVGIYGVMSYMVTQRAHDIGIRMALGARHEDVLKLVVGQGIRLMLVGEGVGFVAALLLARFLPSLLYGVRPTDPLTFAAVSTVLAAVALLATYLPGRRAIKVDPMVALRYE